MDLFSSPALSFCYLFSSIARRYVLRIQLFVANQEWQQHANLLLDCHLQDFPAMSSLSANGFNRATSIAIVYCTVWFFEFPQFNYIQCILKYKSQTEVCFSALNLSSRYTQYNKTGGNPKRHTVEPQLQQLAMFTCIDFVFESVCFPYPKGNT